MYETFVWERMFGETRAARQRSTANGRGPDETKKLGPDEPFEREPMTSIFVRSWLLLSLMKSRNLTKIL